MSSLPGTRIAGKRARSAVMISRVSSTESVVCVSTERGLSSRTASFATSSTVSTRCMRSGACPSVPSTSTWPRWPTSTIS